jgi:hypothetical protein
MHHGRPRAGLDVDVLVNARLTRECKKELIRELIFFETRININCLKRRDRIDILEA